jgi:hypothetical protein
MDATIPVLTFDMEIVLQGDGVSARGGGSDTAAQAGPFVHFMRRELAEAWDRLLAEENWLRIERAFVEWVQAAVSARVLAGGQGNEPATQRQWGFLAQLGLAGHAPKSLTKRDAHMLITREKLKRIVDPRECGDDADGGDPFDPESMTQPELAEALLKNLSRLEEYGKAVVAGRSPGVVDVGEYVIRFSRKDDGSWGLKVVPRSGEVHTKEAADRLRRALDQVDLVDLLCTACFYPDAEDRGRARQRLLEIIRGEPERELAPSTTQASTDGETAAGAPSGDDLAGEGIAVECLTCSARYRVPEDLSGLTVPCRKCDNPVSVPGTTKLVEGKGGRTRGGLLGWLRGR